MLTIKVDNDTELRTYEYEHAEEVFAVVDQNRSYLREWLTWVDSTTSVEIVKDFIKHSLTQLEQDDGFQAGIWHKGTFVGGIGYHSIDRYDRKTEIGYWLAASYQGKGIMTNACKTLITYAFVEYKLNRVEIHCASGNSRSRAIPERLGFTQEGVLREAAWLYDHFVDHIIYGLLTREWHITPI